jgi:hypothetical protein
MEPKTPVVSSPKRPLKLGSSFQYLPLLEMIESSSVQMTIKSARIHICHYLIAVVEAVDSYITEEVSVAIKKKVLFDNTVSSPTNKQSKSSSKNFDLDNFSNFVAAAQKAKPSLDKVNLSNMMICLNYLER